MFFEKCKLFPKLKMSPKGSRDLLSPLSSLISQLNEIKFHLIAQVPGVSFNDLGNEDEVFENDVADGHEE